MDGLILDIDLPERIAPFVPPICLSPPTAGYLTFALILLLGIALADTFFPGQRLTAVAMDDPIASFAPLPFIAAAFVILIAIAGLDAHDPDRSAALAFRDILLLAALHFALAACVLIAAISLGHAA